MGQVYQTTDQIVTVEASNIHEARVVLRGQELVGFYLPVERRLAPVEPALPTYHGRLPIYLSIVLSAAVQPAVLANGVPIGNPVLRGLRVVDRPLGDYEIKPALLT